jgi:hypothetical protein
MTTTDKIAEIALDALEDIALWNDTLDTEWDDPGVRALEAIKEIKKALLYETNTES